MSSRGARGSCKRDEVSEASARSAAKSLRKGATVLLDALGSRAADGEEVQGVLVAVEALRKRREGARPRGAKGSSAKVGDER